MSAILVVVLACLPAFSSKWELAGERGELVACVDEGKGKRCFAIARTGKIAPATAPAPPARASGRIAEIRRGPAPEACAGTRCNKLGPKLVKALGEYDARKAELDNDSTDANELPPAKVTDDLAAVTLERAVWSVEHDRPLVLAPPYRAREAPVLVDVDVVGDRLLPMWTTCAGPCTKSVIADSKGKTRSAVFSSGELFVLDMQRVVVLPTEQPLITVLDLVAAKHRGAISFSSTSALERFSFAARLTDDVIAVAFEWPHDRWLVTWVRVAPGRKPQLLARRELPFCPAS